MSGDVEAAFATLDRREALTVVLVDVIGLTLVEVAAVFEVSRAMAWLLHTRAHRKIGAALGRIRSGRANYGRAA